MDNGPCCLCDLLQRGFQERGTNESSSSSSSSSSRQRVVAVAVEGEGEGVEARRISVAAVVATRLHDGTGSGFAT